MCPQDPRVMRVHNEFMKFPAKYNRRMAVIEESLYAKLLSLDIYVSRFKAFILECFRKMVTEQMEREYLSRASV